MRSKAVIGTKPYAKLKYREVKGRQMAYIDKGEGDAIVFQHGQPASSCVRTTDAVRAYRNLSCLTPTRLIHFPFLDLLLIRLLQLESGAIGILC